MRADTEDGGTQPKATTMPTDPQQRYAKCCVVSAMTAVFKSEDQTPKRTNYRLRLGIDSRCPFETYVVLAEVVRRFSDIGAMFHPVIVAPDPIAWTAISGAVCPA